MHSFEEKFTSFTKKYSSWVEKILLKPKRWLIFYLAIIVASSYIFIKLPTSFLPDQVTFKLNFFLYQYFFIHDLSYSIP